MLTRLSVDPIGLSTAMKITFESDDPGKAAQIANAFANAYVEDQLEAKFEATQKATQWLSGRIGELSHEAQAADSAVQQYKAEHNITTTANGLSVVDQQIAEINSQLTLARTDLAEKQSSYSRLAELARAGRAANSAQVMASPVIAALRAQESVLNGQMADLSSKYGPRHPKILDLQAQKATLDSKIAEEVQRVVDSAKNDVEVSQSHEFIARTKPASTRIPRRRPEPGRSAIDGAAIGGDIHARHVRSLFRAPQSDSRTGRH